MSTLNNETLYETCFDECFDEYMNQNNYTGLEMSEMIRIRPSVLDIIDEMAWRKFQSMCQQSNCPPNPPQWGFFAIIKESKEFLIMDPRFEEEALAALMEEAFSQTTEETKFDVDAYFNSDIDY